MDHDDGCRCMACCAEKFKKLDPATFGKAPQSGTERPCNHTFYSTCCRIALPDPRPDP